MMAVSRKKTASSERHNGGCHCGERDARAESREFDLSVLSQLTELMEKYRLAEVELAQGDDYVHVRRAVSPSTSEEAVPQTAPIPATPVVEEKAAVPAKTINSPMVGTFYRSATQGGKPLASEGDTVGPETVVCIVEAMKVFNQIPAEMSGRITKVLVEDGHAVEFGQPLFAVE